MASYDDTATVSGSVVSIENGADDVPTKSLVVTIAPTLSGKSEVTETQTGRNLFSYDLPLYEGYWLSGFQGTGNQVDYATATGWLFYKIPVKEGTTITFSGMQALGGVYCAFFQDTPDNIISTFLNGSINGTRQVPVGANFVGVEINRGGSPQRDPKTEYPQAQLELGSTTHAYEPYQTPTQYTASLGRTIYGGQADIVNGTAEPTNYLDTANAETKTHNSVSIACDGNGKYTATGTATGGSANITFTLKTPCTIQNGMYLHLMNSGANASVSITLQKQDNTTIYAPALSPANRIADLSSYAGQTIYSIRFYVVNGASFEMTLTPMLCYSSAVTPYSPYFAPFTFTGQEVPTRLGYNAFWSEQGDTELTYYKSGYGFTSVTVNKTGKNLISVPIFTPSTPTLCFDAGRDITVSNITMSFLATNAVVHATNTAIVDYRKEDGTHTYRTLNWFRDANNNQFTANTPQNGKFKNSDSNITFRYIYIYYESISYSQFESDCISEWQIELASTAHAYEPYEAVTKTAKLHKVIYGGTADVIRGTCEPKNMLPMTNYDGGVYNPDVGRQLNLTVSQTQFEKTGGVYSVSTTSTWKTFTVLFPIISGATYYEKWTLSVESGQQGSTRAYLDEDFKVLAKYNNNSSTPITTNGVMSPPTGAKYLAITWTNRGTAVQTLNITEPQIEKGTSASDYAPYFEPFTFPPISMETDEGENTLFANDGDSAITYRKAVD